MTAAWIGAGAVVLAALIAGVFAVLAGASDRSTSTNVCSDHTNCTIQQGSGGRG